MPFLDQIIQKLNEGWLKSSLKSVPPGKIKTYGIAESMLDVRPVVVIDKKTDEETETDKQFRFPAVLDNDGEAKMIDVDDQYHVIFYHKLESISNAADVKKGYGDEPGQMIEIANMSLMVFAFRNKVRKTPNWIEALLKDSVPSNIILKDPADDRKVMQRSSFKIGNSSFDKLGLLSREYSEVELNYMNLIVFEIKYRIESSWNRGCFNKNCGC